MTETELTPVFLTGGTGYLGTHLRERLTERGWPVTLFVRPGTNVDSSPNESIVRGDVTVRDSIDVRGHGSVLHLAARTDVRDAVERPRPMWETNAQGTLNVLEAARSADVDRVLYTSTSRVYGDPVKLPITETHPTAPVEPYGASKLAGEAIVRSWAEAYDLSTVVVRPFNSFGARQPTTNVAALIAAQIRSGGPVELRELSSERDFLYVPDIVSGLLTALTDGNSGEAYNVGSGVSISIGELAEIAVEASSDDIPIRVTGDESQNGDGAIDRSVADNRKIRSLGWSPDYSVAEGWQTFLS